MKKKIFASIMLLLLLGCIFVFLLLQVLHMYACVEGGGTWSWWKLQCTPYQGEH